MSKKVTNIEFIQNAIKIHNKYDYSLVDYINNSTKVKIICKKHGIFKQTPASHLNGRGCSKCAYILKSNNRRKTQEQFIIELNKIHNNKYNYSLVNYINDRTKIKIICLIHGEFKQTANSHLHGSGCPKCGKLITYNKTRKAQEQFIGEATIKHNNKYNYCCVNYINNVIKVKIMCPKHGVFEQSPRNHLNGNGCQSCNQSKGEIKIRQFLLNKNIEHTYQKAFNDCKYKQNLQFDFYLPKQNMCIEYDGKQHFESNEYFGGIESLKYQQKRDEIKNEYCNKNNISLIRIKYDENVELKLNSVI